MQVILIGVYALIGIVLTGVFIIASLLTRILLEVQALRREKLEGLRQKT